MFRMSHIAGLIAAAAIAGAIAVGLPQIMPPGLLAAPVVISGLIGIVVFLFLMLLHEAAVRHGTQKALAGRMLALADLVARLREDLRQLRDVQRVQAVAIEGAAEVETVAAELRGLQAQVDQLALRREAAAVRAGGHDDEPRLN